MTDTRMDDDELREALDKLNAKPWRQWADLIRRGFTEPRNLAPARRAVPSEPIDWRAAGVFAVVAVTFLAGFAYSLAEMLPNVHRGDPFAPLAALGDVVVSAAIALFAAGSVAMFFTQD